MQNAESIGESMRSKNLIEPRGIFWMAAGEMVFNHCVNGDRIAHALIPYVGELGVSPQPTSLMLARSLLKLKFTPDLPGVQSEG